MSLTMTVPPAVPSLFHNSTPPLPSVAVKYSTPLTSTRLLGEPLAVPAGSMVLMSYQLDSRPSYRILGMLLATIPVSVALRITCCLDNRQVQVAGNTGLVMLEYPVALRSTNIR
jgi:hypothetical protein